MARIELGYAIVGRAALSLRMKEYYNRHAG